jgi:GTP pyrophosphokinase
MVTKTRIDKLGDRLRKGVMTDSDLKLLDAYRRSFGMSYETVVGAIRRTLSLEPTGRPAKSTTAIIDKLHRESIRLTQMQDIAGCRIVVADIVAQERAVESLKNLFWRSVVVDRRSRPSYGYRAVHVIVSVADKVVEVQVRTALQHQWAELSEKFSDVIDPAIKYGAGDDAALSLLGRLTDLVSTFETTEARLERFVTRSGLVDEKTKAEIAKLRTQFPITKQGIVSLLQGSIAELEKTRKKK